jgi:hypothetical protein
MNRIGSFWRIDARSIVVVAAADAAADRRADDDRARVLAARAVPELGQLVHDLIEGREDEVAELDLRHRAQAVQGHADRGADDAGLGQRRVDHAIAAELLEEAAGGAEHAAELADVLAEHDGARVLAHLQAQRVVDRLDDVHDGHGGLRSSRGGGGSWSEPGP